MLELDDWMIIYSVYDLGSKRNSQDSTSAAEPLSLSLNDGLASSSRIPRDVSNFKLERSQSDLTYNTNSATKETLINKLLIINKLGRSGLFKPLVPVKMQIQMCSNDP